MCGAIGYSVRSRMLERLELQVHAALHARRRFDLVEHLHARRDDGVVLDALVVVQRLPQEHVDAATDRRLFGAERTL